MFKFQKIYTILKFFMSVCLILLNFACTRYYDTYSQREFQAWAENQGYTYIVRAQNPYSINHLGIGDTVRSFAQTAADHTLEGVKNLAMEMCGPSCIISSINGRITPEAQKYVDRAMKRQEEKVEKEKIEIETDADISPYI